MNSIVQKNILEFLPILIQIMHISIPLVYLIAILFTTNLYTLFLIMLGNFVLLEYYNYFNKCVLTTYESYDKNTRSSIPYTICSAISSDDLCKKYNNLEKEFIISPIVISFVKFVCIVLAKDISGFLYTS
jgi:hypothetical protein